MEHAVHVAIFLPAVTGLAVLALPGRWARGVGSAGTLLTLAAVAGLWLAFDPGRAGLQLRTVAPWIPGIGAAYDVAVDGFGLPLMTLAAFLYVLVAAHAFGRRERPRAHVFLFLLMETGLMGLFAAQDLLLFYVFFEVALVPMYFVIGGWGHGRPRYSSLKFFLYTRAGALAVLLAFLALYLATAPRTFSLPAIAAARPLAGAPDLAGLVLLGLLAGFGVKIPVVPVHNWLPDAHVDAPTEGSVVLAGLQLKIGGFGLLRVALPALPAAAERWGVAFVVVGLVSLLYGALAALGQRDFKRLVAYTSISHMGYVVVAAGAWALAAEPAVRSLALNGAVFQMVSHGLLTGGMFFLAGILDAHAGTRDLDRVGGLSRRLPAFAFVLAVLAFGSLGIPGMSGFVAELQVLGATVAFNGWAAGVIALGLLITTGLYLHVVTRLLWREAPPDAAPPSRPRPGELAVAAILAAGSVLLGVLPWPFLRVIEGAARALGPAGIVGVGGP